MGLAEFLRLEQITAMYRQITPSLMIMALTVYTVSFVALWPVYNKTVLIIWYSTGIITTICRRLSAKKFLTLDITTENCKPWADKATLWAFLSGISWGLVFIFFSSPDHFFQLIFLLGVYGCLVSLSASNFGSYIPVYFAFSLSITLLFLGKLIYIGDNVFYIAGALVIAYFIEITSMALNAQNSFNKTTELRFFNNKLLKEVVTQKEAAENAALAKNQFLAAASHDLRQPLHAQGLFVDALKKQNLPQSTEEIVTKIQLSTDALNSLLNSLLDVSRLDANSIEYSPSNIQLYPLIKSIIDEYDERASEKGIHFELELIENISVNSDEALLSRLIRNLIDNAVKFTDDGEISIRSQSNSKEVLLTINDTGRGIPQSEQENVFSEFTQLGNPERDRQKGLGLGLAIVKRLANLIDIEVKMQSILNIGTSFSLSIPPGNSNASDITETENNPINTTAEFIGETILVIDDETDILDGMDYVINNWGATVITATCTVTAIKKLQEQQCQPSLILADFRLRNNENGIDAITAIREHFDEPIKAILITGDTAPDRLQLALSANATVLHKPVTSCLLQATARKVLSEPL